MNGVFVCLIFFRNALRKTEQINCSQKFKSRFDKGILKVRIGENRCSIFHWTVTTVNEMYCICITEFNENTLLVFQKQQKNNSKLWNIWKVSTTSGEASDFRQANGIWLITRIVICEMWCDHRISMTRPRLKYVSVFFQTQHSSSTHKHLHSFLREKKPNKLYVRIHKLFNNIDYKL